MTRVAAIDCGTNSIRLLLADVAGNTLTDHVRRMEVVRLGEGVDRTGRLSDEALARTFAAVEDYAREIELYGAERVRFVATSASRDAANAGQFTAGVRARLGVEPEVVPGSEEAALSFAGATRELRDRPGIAPPYLVIDIGGGSTEFVLGTEHVDAARSVDIGCVRLTERHLVGDPPTSAQLAATIADIDAAIDIAASSVPMDGPLTLVGLAGSVTTVAAIALRLPAYDPVAIHHSRVAAADVHAITSALLAMTHAERAAIGVMHPGRVDVIGAGALILERIMRRVDAEDVVVSEHDILDGIAYSLVDC
ncbi:MAG: exopolyphosphatase / guanosine-5-triphosphate,3-diphosphate pyrophosphatase [Frankiaceae bacterium]|nr:exopolyphosphatase / guanosine-5-triphosphate,3-diphosphate pyrophosphatase [Frankiaceae bacterium]